MDTNNFYDDANIPPLPPVGPATAPAPLAHDWNPRFTPGSIMVHYNDGYAAFLPTDILPAMHRGTCFMAQHLAFHDFIKLTCAKLDTSLENKQLLADLGKVALMPINTGKDWYVAMQLFHDKGLKVCDFQVLGEDVAVEPQQVTGRGWGGMVAAMGTFGAVGVAAVAGAVQMGYLPGSFPG